MTEEVMEIMHTAIDKAYYYGEIAGREYERLRNEIRDLEQDIDYLKGQVDSLKVENAALQKKVKKLKGDADGD